jgi:hypothetical protein
VWILTNAGKKSSIIAIEIAAPGNVNPNGASRQGFLPAPLDVA